MSASTLPRSQILIVSCRNIGFGNYAKWWTVKPDANCSPDNPIDCEIVKAEDNIGGDPGTSGFWLWNEGINEGELLPVIQASAKRMTGEADQHSFDDVMASAWLGGDKFWSWTSPKNVKDICSEYSKEVGGIFVWGTNADDQGASGGAHMKELSLCAKNAGA